MGNNGIQYITLAALPPEFRCLRVSTPIEMSGDKDSQIHVDATMNCHSTTVHFPWMTSSKSVIGVRVDHANLRFRDAELSNAVLNDGFEWLANSRVQSPWRV